MEVYTRSSWFLLLLGFALIAATLQETTDCPTPDQVSCTTGTKCSSIEDCQKNELCCANPCYTKRCIPTTKGVQGEADGPSETDCRPYIEKALKELETGEAGQAQEPSVQDESVEDVATVEITDDSSHQEEEFGGGGASDEAEDLETSTEQDEAQQGASQEKESDETPDEEHSEEKDEPEETNAEPSKEESAEEQAQKEKSAEVEEVKMVKREVPELPNLPETESVPLETADDDDAQSEEKEDEKSVEEVADEESTEYLAPESEETVEDVAQEASTEEQASTEDAEEIGCPPPDQVSCTEGDICSKHRHCGEDQICCANKCYRRRCTPGAVPQEERDAESASEESEEKSAEKMDGPSVPGCPPASDVSCTEGDLCSKHRHCGEDQICCPNKCYRRRCTPGTATSAELAGESDEDSAEEDKESAERTIAPKTSNTGCPAPTDLSCVDGELCSKHRQCGDDEICCTNKCYRKRCTPGTPTEDDLLSDGPEEESKEDVKGAAIKSIPKKDTGCPERGDIPCSGEMCNKNKNCNDGEICCANKCYRKVCVAGKPGSDEVEEESEEEQEKSEEVAASIESKEEEGACPPPQQVSCSDGERCGDDEDCRSNEICCPNKCYNKRCIPAGAEEEKSTEELPKPTIKPTPSPVKPRESKEPTKPKVKEPPPPPPPPVKRPEPKAPSKPIVILEPVVEEDESLEKGAEAPVEELSLDTDMPTDLRARDHVEHLLKVDQDVSKLEQLQTRVYEDTLKELKRLYENAIKPLEGLYKYRDLSNRHFGDAEIFSKPLVLFMGPWSGGKSSIINYLLNNEYNETSLRTGAEPSPAYFNILMHGDEPEIIDGTELAADFTFSGLQKFGQGLEERLRGVKLPSRLLEKVNIVEIPGILEVRKQVSRVFPFNDACQWFIDRADIIFLVYDPSKLDVGPETEAILDQLKGREHQTRIILNKADQVKPEELMRVQGALIWNISPLMSSPQPPVMYTTSLWSRAYEPWAPTRLLQAQERAFLRDLRTAVDKRVENKIASARRFAVRVRNHAKMVDCYLTTYYNHKSVFGNRKQVANEIIERPQDYHIYEGLSTLTNISRYDLPDPDVYRDFFKLNPLYEFQQLSATCTYFRGCPINRLDIAIAYDLPELIGTYKRNLEEAIHVANNPPKEQPPSSKKTKKSAPGS